MATIITSDEKQKVRDGLLRAIGRAVSGDPGNTIDGQSVPSFLAGPEPGDPIGKFQHRGGRATCDRWARGERSGILPSRDKWLRQLCTPYLGGDSPGDPETGPSVEGGQCENVPYFLTWEARLAQSGGGFAWVPLADGNFTGPVTVTPGVDNNGPGCPAGQSLVQWTVTGAGGSRPTTLVGGCVDVAPGYRNLVATPAFGGPNDCGDGDDLFNPGDPNPTPDPSPGPVGGPPGYPFPDFDIRISPQGDIIVDFGDGSDPDVIEPGPQEPGDTTGDGGGGGGGAPTNPGGAGGTGTTGDGGEDSGEAGDGQELTGVLVEVLDAPGNANRFDNVSTVVYRGVGYISMGYPGLLGVDTSASVVESPQFFHAQQRGLTAWRVRANVGFNLRTTPYYRETEQ